MGVCLSKAAKLETPERFKGRWAQQGGLGDGVAAFGVHDASKPAYTTTADVGLKDNKFNYLHENKPAPLQLERIEEDATLQGGAESSPLKTAQLVRTPPEVQVHIQRKPINWTRGELVGQGAFGSVFVAMDNDTGELIAVKQIHLPRGGGAHSKKVEQNIRDVEDEVQLLQQFDHVNIVRYLGTEKTEESLNIFLEYVPGGSIASLLAKFGSFKESVIKVYTKQILMGLEYLHSKGIMHRDIKGANILVDNTGLVKLADFGASKKLEDLVTVADGNKSVRGTPYWMAPEVITQTGHGRQADLWSVACTVLEMATGRPPWSTQYPSQVAAMFHIASSKGPPEIPQHLSPECKDFLYLCFNRDWKARPLAATLLRHPFLADVTVRSQSGPSPNAMALTQGWRMPRSSSGNAVGFEGDGQFRTPSPMNPKLAMAAQAGMANGGAARISLQTTEGGAPSDSSALSPLGNNAAAASKPSDWAEAASQLEAKEAELQQLQAAPLRDPAATTRRSPVKRPALSLRASAPAFSGYASVALSQQSEQAPLVSRLAAPPIQRQPSSNLRTSGESGSVLTSTTTATGAASQQQEVRRSGSGGQADREASSHALPAALPELDTASIPATIAVEPYETALLQDASLPATLDLRQPSQPDLLPVAAAAAAAPQETPAAQRRRAAERQALETPAMRALGQAAVAPSSVDNSSGTNKSDYNPMEEPSWMHSMESPLAGEGTPTSAPAAAPLADTLPVGLPLGPAAAAASDAGTLSREASGLSVVGEQPPMRSQQQLPEVLQAPQAMAAPAVAGVAAVAAALPPPPPLVQHPSAEHMVWTNEDGDIDALPWDTMGGWSTSSSGQHAGEQPPLAGEQQVAARENSGPQPSDAVDEEALIGALQRKAQHDVRASLALFEKSLNIPAVHAAEPFTIPAVKPAPLAAMPQPQPQLHAAELLRPSGADSMQGQAPLVPGLPGPRKDRRQSFPLAQPLRAPVDDGRRRSAAAQPLSLLAGGRDTGGMAPPPAPLAAAIAGLASLGYGANAGTGGGDKESVWEQELSSELFRVKASTGTVGGVPNRRISMHGSPIKRPGSIHQ